MIKHNETPCRFYESVLPEVGEIVIVRVISINETAAYVSLLEYGEIEGMILLTELSRRRVRSIDKLIRIGRVEIAVVLHVDPEMGYVDLSKRRVIPEEIGKAEERYKLAKTVNSILNSILKQIMVKGNVGNVGTAVKGVEDNHALIQIHENFTWPLYSKFGHAHKALKLCLTDPEEVFNTEGVDVTPEFKALLLESVKLRLSTIHVKLHADLYVRCFTHHGIEAIKIALTKGLEASTEQIPLNIAVAGNKRAKIGSVYRIMTKTTNKELGLKVISNAIEKITECIKTYGGDVVIVVPPKTYSNTEDHAVTEQDRADREELERRKANGEEFDSDDVSTEDSNVRREQNLSDDDN